MAKGKECIAMLLAGGQGSRLYPMTKTMAKPALPFGGKYRIIDFPLSNCVNSGIDTVGVLTQYQPLELNDYLGTGQPWDLDRNHGGLHILPPYQTTTGSDWFKGTANAIYQNLHFIEKYNAKYVIILSGDHIYKMNYNKMLEKHKEKEADCTIAVMDVPISEASRFGIMTADETGRITEFEEKPKRPKSTKASMGIYIFTYDVMKEYLIKDENDKQSNNDFGKNVIPSMLYDGCRMFTFDFSGYWKDVGTFPSYWESNMDLLNSGNSLALSDPSWKIYYRRNTMPPHYIGKSAKVKHSIVVEGCEIDGTVEDSVLFSGVKVEKGAVVKNSVILQDCVIKAGARVNDSVFDNNVTIGENSVIGESLKNAPGKITVIAEGISVGKSGFVPAGSTLEESIPDDDKEVLV